MKASKTAVLGVVIAAGTFFVILAAYGAAYLIGWRQLSTRQAGRDVTNPVASTAYGLDAGEAPRAENFFPIEATDRQPVVSDFEVVPAAEVGQRVADEELVLAVEINGQARAYPLNVMTGPEREVFNDHLGDRAIAATW